MKVVVEDESQARPRADDSRWVAATGAAMRRTAGAGACGADWLGIRRIEV